MRFSDFPKETQKRLRAEGRVPDLPKTKAAGGGRTSRRGRGRSRAASPPQQILWQAVSARWPQAVAEYQAIPGRRYSLDVAFPEVKLAIEVDGFRHHGKFLDDFTRDRVRQNLIVEAGWRVLRFTAGQVYQSMDECLAQIERLLGDMSTRCEPATSCSEDIDGAEQGPF
ncbi:MAG: DUF559 domain-containing protein [Gammaproteobacteria bacterium]|nr:DUF559 domain-containing protein [Gammaproteobacteria bacterium]